MTAALAWPFVIAAYVVAVGGTLALTGWPIAALKRAEAEADALNQR